MVDCRPSAGGAPHEMPPNGVEPQPPNQPPRIVSGEMVPPPVNGPGIVSPSVRATTPATAAPINPYAVPVVSGCGYACGKGMAWCGPHSMHHPPPHVNPHVYKSVQPNGSDLPMNDIPTLRYYFNLGVECMYASYGPPPQPPRHYSPTHLAQEMQQVSIHDRPPPINNVPDQNGQRHNKPINNHNNMDKNNQNKGNGQRPLLGPRFKRGGNGDGQVNQNKGHNNNGNGPKGQNNRRNSQGDTRTAMGHKYWNGPIAGPGPMANGPDPAVEPALIALPYMAYPPPIYPMSYYPIDADPAMMGMLGMNYMGYEEGVEYGAPIQFIPPPYPPPTHVPAHVEHK